MARNKETRCPIMEVGHTAIVRDSFSLQADHFPKVASGYVRTVEACCTNSKHPRPVIIVFEPWVGSGRPASSHPRVCSCAAVGWSRCGWWDGRIRMALQAWRAVNTGGYLHEGCREWRCQWRRKSAAWPAPRFVSPATLSLQIYAESRMLLSLTSDTSRVQ
jgi:hypothetical protein